jgi:DNA-binding transcriptional regulator YiaG
LIDKKAESALFAHMNKYDPSTETYTAMRPHELRAAREEMGLTQMEAARKYEIKLRTYKNYELGGTGIPGPVKLLTAFFVREHRNIDVKS